MCDEKDMIEINLNTPSMPLEGHETNYFGNINFARAYRGFPYGLHEDDTDVDDDTQKTKQKSVAQRLDASLVDRQTKISCLRQMYCPSCQQRLDADGVRYEKQMTRCLPLFPLSCMYPCCLRRPHSRSRVFCKKCDSNLGYWKRS